MCLEAYSLMSAHKNNIITEIIIIITIIFFMNE